MTTPSVIEWFADDHIKFSLAGTPDLFREGDTFMLDVNGEPVEMSIIEAVYDEGRVVTATFDVYPGTWTVEAKLPYDIPD